MIKVNVAGVCHSATARGIVISSVEGIIFRRALIGGHVGSAHCFGTDCAPLCFE